MMKNDYEKNLISDYILIGDTGEKDEDAGDRIAIKYGPNKMKAIFLHAVSDNHDITAIEADDKYGGGIELPDDRICNQVPIFYFRTYVGAATKAFRAKLIGPEAVKRIINNAQQGLKQLDPLFISMMESERSVSSSKSSYGDNTPLKSIISSLPSSDKETFLLSEGSKLAKSRWNDLKLDISEAQQVLAKSGYSV